jgi:hypothetical protein
MEEAQKIKWDLVQQTHGDQIRTEMSNKTFSQQEMQVQILAWKTISYSKSTLVFTDYSKFKFKSITGQF